MSLTAKPATFHCPLCLMLLVVFFFQLVSMFANQIISFQGQKRSAFAVGALFHDHLFSVLFIFTGIFLVNHVLMNSAAADSTNTLLLTFQDVVELMNQVSTIVPTTSPCDMLSWC